MRSCFGLAACYEPKGDYCKACDKKVECASQVKITVNKIEGAGQVTSDIQSNEAEVIKEQFAERLSALAKHPRALVEHLISIGMYVNKDILRSGQRSKGKIIFWHAIDLLRHVGQLQRAELVSFALSEGMSFATANSEATAAIKALEFFDIASKHGKQYRIKL